MTTRARLGIVYILKFHRAIGNPDKKHGTAQYYVGWARSPQHLRRRLWAHAHGYGARLTRAFALAGIGFDLVACWTGTTDEEKRVKAYKNTRLFIEREGWRPLYDRMGKIPF